jgi:hypothetical protein
LIREGELVFKRDFVPLRLPLSISGGFASLRLSCILYSFKGEGEDLFLRGAFAPLLVIVGILGYLRGAEPLFFISFPLSLTEERGIKGVRSPYKGNIDKVYKHIMERETEKVGQHLSELWGGAGKQSLLELFYCFGQRRLWRYRHLAHHLVYLL